MKSFIIGVGAVAVLVIVFFFAPALNESRMSSALEPAFEVFKSVTVKNYPDKTAREATFAKVLAEKARIVKESSWPLMACEATFTARNPGTIHRKDVRAVSCSW